MLAGRFGMDDQQPPKMDEEWIVLRSCVWIQEAQVVKSLLEAGGIDAFIPDEYFLGANPHYGIALGGARVMVRSTDLEQASAILDAMEVPESGSEGSDAEQLG